MSLCARRNVCVNQWVQKWVRERKSIFSMCVCLCVHTYVCACVWKYMHVCSFAILFFLSRPIQRNCWHSRSIFPWPKNDCPFRNTWVRRHHVPQHTWLLVTENHAIQDCLLTGITKQQEVDRQHWSKLQTSAFYLQFKTAHVHTQYRRKWNNSW